MTVGALGELEEGVRTAFARGIHARKSKDGTITIYLRRKINGKSDDTKVTVLADINRKSVNEAIAAVEAIRNVKPAPKAEKVVAVAGKLNTRSSMREVWEHQLADIKRSKYWSDTNCKLNEGRIAAHCATWDCWDTPLADIGSEDLTTPLLALRDKFSHQAKKVQGLVAGIFRHGTVERVIAEDADPMPHVARRLAHNFKRPKAKNFDALLDIEELRKLVVAIRNATGDASVRNALYLQAMTCVRTGEVIEATWGEFDLDAKAPTWTVPRSRMKISDPSRPDHVLHLAPATVAWLKTLPKGKAGDYLFPGRAERSFVTSESVSKAMRLTLKMKDKHTPHGWRSSMATLARGAVDESGRPMFAESWIEGLMDHLSGDAVKDAYLRKRDVEGIGRVLAWWAGQLGV